MELILQVFYSVFSGSLLAAAIPNELYLFGCPLLTLIAFIPYYLIFNSIKNYRQAFLCGFFQAITTHLISSFWLAYFKDFAILTLGASAFGTGMIGGFLALFIYLPFSSSKKHNRLNQYTLNQNFFDSVSFRILYFAALYTIYEWVKSCGFLGYPWGTVSSAIYKWPLLMQLSSITGTYGITFVLVLLNAFFAEILLYYKESEEKSSNSLFSLKQTGCLCIVLFACILVHGLFQYTIPRKPVKQLNTLIVQQNSDPWKEKTDSDSILTSEKLTDEILYSIKEDEEPVNLVVWSEGCLKHVFPGAENYYNYHPEERPLLKYVNEKNVPFIIGGAFLKDRAQKKYFNAALLFDKNGKFRGCYGKNHLVPFAEALPFIEYPSVKAIMQKIIGISAGWTPGDQYVYFDVPCRITSDYKLPAVKNIDLTKTYDQQKREEEQPVTVRLSTPICFDDAFTDIMRPMFLNGAELFVNITDDSWSLKESSEIQHFVIASYRSIEYRTTMIRSTNAGYSVVITPNGKVISDLPLFQATSAAFDVPVYKRVMTTYARFGNWLPYSLIILFVIYSVYSYMIFTESDYIPSERKMKSKKKKKSKLHKKNEK